MLAMEKARWNNHPPLTVLGSSAAIKNMYFNPDTSAYWHTVKAKSKSWKSRHDLLNELAQREERLNDSDLDPNVMNLIVVDSVFKNAAGEQRVGDMGALNQLMSAIVRKYTAIIPSVTIKTGMSFKDQSPGT